MAQGFEIWYPNTPNEALAITNFHPLFVVKCCMLLRVGNGNKHFKCTIQQAVSVHTKRKHRLSGIMVIWVIVTPPKQKLYCGPPGFPWPFSLETSALEDTYHCTS